MLCKFIQRDAKENLSSSDSVLMYVQSTPISYVLKAAILRKTAQFAHRNYLSMKFYVLYLRHNTVRVSSDAQSCI